MCSTKSKNKGGNSAMPVKRNKRGQTFYYGRVVLPDKKVKEKQFRKRSEAVKWEVAMLAEAERLQSPGTTCGQWAEQYLDHIQARKLRSYDKVQLAFQRFFLDVDPFIDVEDLTVHACRLHLDRVAREISGTAANKSKGLLTTAWTWAVMDLGIPPACPFVRVAKYKTVQREVYVPPESDFWKVYDVANEKHKLMLLTYLYTAARRDEVKRLTWDDIDLTDGLIRLWTRKRKGGWEYNWLPMAQTLRLRLAEWKLQHGQDPHVFMNQAGTDRIRSGRYFMPLLTKRADVRHFGVHAIRHLTAVTLYREGETLSTIQQILRHKNAATTEKYLRSLGVHQTTRPAMDAFDVARSARGNAPQKAENS
jgi:integrase